MELSEFYKRLRAELQANGLKVLFRQPQPTDALPLVHINVHTDLDVSAKTGTLNQVMQQVDYYNEGSAAPVKVEADINKVRNAMAKVVRWDNLTTQTTSDLSSGRELKRAMFLLTITI
ncbi:hypothetical protein G168_gp11 [Lactobacillus phage ATCC8014]|jgi:hypothetical protein|uniref:Phage protein n=1 Tax=Lactobacillus phage ATCC8014 TaxID=2892340 RepID=K4I072_9CAUD|nr:hypothetical protein G168_gp11 [Lactobacillus phage ATCC8014]AFU63018.1 hypothetical protein 8014-B1_0011 [Lactobacillus phage ATCC8014]